eukprot:Gb_35092 [translate_table: standard]
MLSTTRYVASESLRKSACKRKATPFSEPPLRSPAALIISALKVERTC